MRKIFAGRISINPRLSPLLQLGRRTFTPAEAKLIFDELREP